MLEILDLSVRYEETTIFANINLRFRKGEVSVITGCSGSGKSTLTKIINGVIPNVEKAEINGTITYAGNSFRDMDIAQRSEYVSTVFQNPRTQFYCTNSTDEMAFALENRGMERSDILQRIQEYSKLMGTEHLLNKDIFRLSGGEKQLVAITSVACMNQDIYIFDEPSSSLDRDSIEKLKNSISILKKMGKIIIIAEHRLYYLREIMDCLHIIENKRILSVSKEKINDEIARKYDLRSFHQILKSELMNENYETKHLLNKDCKKEHKLSCIDYHYFYKKHHDVFDMNLSFGEDITFIIGKNGVGKTTFIRSICGLNKNFKGKTYYEHHSIKQPNKLISLVMQDVNYQLFTESVAEEMSIITDDEKKKEGILRELGLWKKRDFHPQSLSGGEKQRLSIALCKASKKPVVIFDEPTSGLCKRNMMKIIEFIHEMAEEGKKIIIITHDYEFIRLCGGKVIEFVR